MNEHAKYPCGASAIGATALPADCPIHGHDCTRIVLLAEAEVGQQVRELVKAISRDGETVVGAVQRLITEQAGLRAALDEQTKAFEQFMLDCARAYRAVHLSTEDVLGILTREGGLRAQVQALRDEWRVVEAPDTWTPTGLEAERQRVKCADALDALLSSVSLPQHQETKR